MLASPHGEADRVVRRPQIVLGTHEPLETGQHLAQVFVEDRPVTPKTPFWVLPPLVWKPNLASTPLVEGALVVGEVAVEGDERFATFRWQPGWDGPAPRPCRVHATLDGQGLEVEAWLTAESVAVRAFDVETGAELNTLSSLSPASLRLHQLQAKKRKLEVYLTSNPDHRVRLTHDDPSALISLRPRGHDTLVVEASHQGTVLFVNRFAVKGQAFGESIKTLLRGGIGYSPLTGR